MRSTAASRARSAFRASSTSIDFRRLARRRLPAVVFAYIDGGAEDEITLRENCRAFRDFTLPSAPVRGGAVLRSAHHGARHARSNSRFCWRRSASAGCSIRAARSVAARAANEAGTGYILSTFSGTRLEEVREGASGPLWFQLYVPGGRDVAEATIARARAAGIRRSS